MSPEQRRRLHELLIERRDALRAEGDVEVEPESDGEVVEKPDEDTAPLAEMNQVIASNRNRERVMRLQQIEAALARLQEDPEGFGHCEECDEPIALRRLEVMPWTKLCIECQSEQERDAQERGGRRRHLTDYKS